MRRSGSTKGVLSKWCSSQNAFVTPERRKFRRVHGLQLPLHPQQVVGWIVILVIVVNTFAIITPLLGPSLRSIFSIVISAIFLTHFFSHLTVLLLDPADPRVRSQPTNKIIPEFDRGKHSHVIENGRCHLCNITTDSKRTKHCSICNKCIVRFDHHCKWLNNCIGARNYTAFLVCLISAILASLFIAGLSATELLLSFSPDRIAMLQVSNETGHAVPTITPVSDAISVLLVSAIGILSAITAILLIHLCLFHGYIACLGLTTYEYVRNKRQRNTVTAAAVAVAAAAAAAAAAATATVTATATATATVIATAIATQTVDTLVAASPTTAEPTIANTAIDLSDSKTIRRDIRRLVSTDTDSCLHCDRRNRRIDIETRESNRIETESSFHRQRDQRKNFRLCLPKREHQSQSVSWSPNYSEPATIPSHDSVGIRATGSSSPSPVSCCFAAANSIAVHCRSTGHKRNEQKKRSTDDRRVDSLDSLRVSTTSCETVERIGKFLRTYLKRNRHRRRRRRSTSSSSSSSRSSVRASKENIDDSNQCRRTEIKMNLESTVSLGDLLETTAISPPRPPPSRLPPLRYSLNDRSIASQLEQKTNELSAAKRNAVAGSSYTRPRRTFSFRKRAKLKLNSHVTQSIRLSPILESEFSKSVTPRSSCSSPISPSSARSTRSSSSPRIDRFVPSSSAI